MVQKKGCFLKSGCSCLTTIGCLILLAAFVFFAVIVWELAPRQTYLDPTAQKNDSISTESDDPTAMIYVGDFKEVIDDESDTQLYMYAWGDELTIEGRDHDEVWLEAKGKIVRSESSCSDRGGLVLPICLKQYEGNEEVVSDDVTIIFEREPNNLHTLHVVFDGEPSESPIRSLMLPHTMFLIDQNMQQIRREVPFNINKEKVAMKALLRELYRYVFERELFATVNYIKHNCDNAELAESEQIVIDEPSRFFSYSNGETNACLEGKYFWMNGKILLVLDKHKAPYEGDQRLRFYIIDPARQTIAEDYRDDFLPEEWADRDDAILQVRPTTDGLVAVFKDKSSTDSKTLKFNGKIFE